MWTFLATTKIESLSILLMFAWKLFHFYVSVEKCLLAWNWDNFITWILCIGLLCRGSIKWHYFYVFWLHVERKPVWFNLSISWAIYSLQRPPLIHLTSQCQWMSQLNSHFHLTQRNKIRRWRYKWRNSNSIPNN